MVRRWNYPLLRDPSSAFLGPMCLEKAIDFMQMFAGRACQSVPATLNELQDHRLNTGRLWIRHYEHPYSVPVLMLALLMIS